VVVLFGTLVGLIYAAWAVVLVSASRAKSILGDILTALLLIAMLSYLLLPNEVIPKPGAIARHMSWATTLVDGAISAVTMIVVAIGGYLLAAKLGLGAWITRLINHDHDQD